MFASWFPVPKPSHPKSRQHRPRLETECLEERCLLDAGFRAIDGSGNNPAHPDWGSAGEALLRLAPAEYGDGVSSPAGANRPSARAISNAIAAQPADDELLNNRNLSAMIYAFGQFLDHDLDLTTPLSPREAFNIPVPAGDPYFDLDGTQVIPLSRSNFDPATGTGPGNPRQQLNDVTSFIDGSMIYGSDEVTARKLRTLVDGKLKVGPNGLLPLNNTANFPTGVLPMGNDTGLVPNDQLYAAGDIRANENIELTALQTLFVREHNYWADRINLETPGLSDEEIYQRARAIVGAELQVITYKEWLPTIFGRDPLGTYRGYNPNVNPGIANEFSTAAFRLGHTLLGADVEFLDNNAEEVAPEIELREAFTNPAKVAETGIGPILKYLATDPARELDNPVVDEVRNFLFGLPGAGGFDLASLNIQRGRDHGLADYNDTRAAYGLPRVRTFAQITSDRELQDKLREQYGNVNNIDLWVGALAEDHLPGSTLGPTLQRILTDQFGRLRDGDSFWYQRVFSGSRLAELEGTTLASIIARNTEINNLQNNVFLFEVRIQGTVFYDDNRNGTQDRREMGLPGIRVELLGEDGAVIARTLTGTGGRYRFTNINEPGTFTVRLTLPRGLVYTSEETQDVTATRGQTISGVDFGLRLSRPPARSLGELADYIASAMDELLGH